MLNGKYNPNELTNEAEIDFSGCFSCTNDCQRRKVGLKLNKAGLQITDLRIQLGKLLFGDGDRHVTADLLYEEAKSAEVPVSLATVYNTLNSFTAAGLLRELRVIGAKRWFDTNVTDHPHFFLGEEGKLVDMPCSADLLEDIISVPTGMKVAKVDMVVILERENS